MNKRGQIGDILEFKIGLIILIVMFFISSVLFSITNIEKQLDSERSYFSRILSMESVGSISVNEKTLDIQKKLLYQDLLRDRLKKDNLGDKIVLGEKIDEDLFILRPTDFDDEEKIKQSYELYFKDVKEEEAIYVSTIGLTTTVIPTFNGDYIIGVTLNE